MRFRPSLLDAVQGYRRSDFSADLGAGLTVACVAMPLAMAFGIASGVKPEQGLITAVVGGFIVSALGGSRVQIGGPAGAFVALLYAVVERYGVANLLISTMMAGVLLMAMGFLKLGQMVRFVPVPIVIGFTNGIAIVIALSQLKDFLGLEIAQMPANFFSQLYTLEQNLHTVNWTALGLGAAALLLLAVWPKAVPQPLHRKELVQDGAPVTPLEPPQTAQPASRGMWRDRLGTVLKVIPGPLVVLILGTLFVWALSLPVETIGSRFGGIPQHLPPMRLPTFDWQTAQNLVAPTLSIAFLGAVESLLCARVADGIIGERHDPNQELVAQGAANLVSPLFGGIAVTGTIARTVTNIRSGARTPVAGMVHAIALLVFMLALAPMARHIPMSVLAAILLFVAWNMGEWHAFARLRHFSNNYRVVMLATFLLTVIFDLTVAVEVGLVLASLLFIMRVSSLTRIERVRLPADLLEGTGGRTVGVWRVFGSLFFGSVDKIEALLDPAEPLPDIMVLEMHQVINMDTTGLDALRGLHRHLERRNGRLILAELNDQPMSLLKRSGFLQALGPRNVFDRVEAAYAEIRSQA
ncbi:MAG TPA: SulP family inorganic anion transporter [Lautropia sp.]|nr:SulP family inorganic anion transporter [Lautropia sp.]